MSVKDIETMLKSQEYDFLRENENLGSNIILLGFGGSHAYGTNNENSDVDTGAFRNSSPADAGA